MADSTFRVGGLVSGMDTNSIIDKLVELERRPIGLYQTRQTSIKTHISSLGTLMSRLDGLAAATKSLGTDGVAALKPANASYDDFSVSGKPTFAGRYKINVDSLAQSAKMRFSSGHPSPDTVVNSSGSGKALTFMIDGTTEYGVTVEDGMTLAQVAAKINAGIPGQASPLTASIVSNGSQYYLTVTRKETGHASALASDSLQLKVDNGDDLDGGLGARITTDARNAKVFVDDLEISSRTNEIKNVIPGATLTLKKASKTDTELVLDRKTDESAANLQKFVDAFNSVATFLKDNLRPDPDAKPDTRVSGSALVTMQLSVQKLISTTTTTSGAIRTLGDLGVKIGKDGLLSLDKEKLDVALTKDPEAVNAVFSRANTGIAAVTEKLVRSKTNGIDGALTVRKQALQGEIERIDKNIAKSEKHVEAFKLRLVKQFTAMEQLLGGFQSISNYLGQQSAAAAKSNT